MSAMPGRSRNELHGSQQCSHPRARANCGVGAVTVLVHDNAARQAAADLCGGGWPESHPLAVDASRFAALNQLSRRQRDIVDRLLRGERIPAIAKAMYISPSTVRNHLSHAFADFGVHSQSELLVVLRSDSDAVQPAKENIETDAATITDSVA